MEEEKKAAPKAASPKRRRGIITACVCVVVVVAAAGGFMVWHEQPSFCSTVCHTPMNSYVESYYSTDGTSLANAHEKAGKDCLTCHTPELGEQITEGLSWVSGDYAYDEETAHLVSRSDEFATQEFCLNESCHNMTRDELTESTSDMAFNPHVQQHGDIDCGECHKAHSESVMYCTQCHAEAEVPDGWMPYSDYMSAKQS